MAKPAIIAKLTFQDGKREEGLRVFDQMFEHVNANEPGTEIYALHTDDKDANVAYFYELYERQGRADGARRQRHDEDGGPRAQGLPGRPARAHMLTPVTAKGIDF